MFASMYISTISYLVPSMVNLKHVIFWVWLTKNTVDDDDDELSGFHLGLATSHADLDLDLATSGKVPADSPLLAFIYCLLRHAGITWSYCTTRNQLQADSINISDCMHPNSFD